MSPVICSNDVETVLNKLKEFVEKHGMIKSLRVIENTDDQIVFLLDEKETITHKEANLFWSGYKAALESNF